mmetsp:Transcript_121478/g.338441  ORF Transcript_121478/g.338441 Transcript_121478/m.338441 type:complete len:413 (+) Transcript_121478:174-1412(+)
MRPAGKLSGGEARAAGDDPLLEPGVLVAEAEVHLASAWRCPTAREDALLCGQVLARLVLGDHLLGLAARRHEGDVIGHLQRADPELPGHRPRPGNVEGLDVGGVPSLHHGEVPRALDGRGVAPEAADALGHEAGSEVLEEGGVVLLPEDHELLSGPLWKERGQGLEGLGEHGREVDEQCLALELRVVLREDLRDGLHATLDLRLVHTPHNARVVVDLDEVLRRTLLKLQQLDRIFHQLRSVPDERLQVAEHLVDVHASEPADHDWPAIRVHTRDEVVLHEVFRQLGLGQLVDLAVGAEDDGLRYPLGGLVHVKLLGAQVLQQHDVGGVCLLLQRDAPHGDASVRQRRGLAGALLGFGDRSWQTLPQLGELLSLGIAQVVEVAPREVHHGCPPGRASTAQGTRARPVACCGCS